jgi:Family of unknown function (DUF5678)
MERGKMENALSFSDQFRDYEDMWVAISESESRIVGSGADPLEAKADAEKKGYTETTLFHVPTFDQLYVP